MIELRAAGNGNLAVRSTVELPDTRSIAAPYFELPTMASHVLRVSIRGGNSGEDHNRLQPS